MEDKPLDLMEQCPMCQGHIHQIDDNEFACSGCLRIWTRSNDEWVSKPRAVKLTKEPEIGDNINEVVKPAKVHQEYVLGFAFSRGGDEVLMIRKNHPEWMKGKFNGIGGKVQENESMLTAMVRECREE